MNGDGGAIPRPEKQNSKFKILWGMVKFHTGSIVCERRFGITEPTPIGCNSRTDGNGNSRKTGSA